MIGSVYVVPIVLTVKGLALSYRNPLVGRKQQTKLFTKGGCDIWRGAAKHCSRGLCWELKSITGNTWVAGRLTRWGKTWETEGGGREEWRQVTESTDQWVRE